MMASSPSSPVYMLVVPHTSRTRFPRLLVPAERTASVRFAFHSSGPSALMRQLPRRMPLDVNRADTAAIPLSLPAFYL